MAGGKYSIDTHPDREKIIKAICKGDQSSRSIAKQFGVTSASVLRYIQGRLLPSAAKEAEKRNEKQGKALNDRLEAVIERMQKMYDACDDYLTDPDNPDRYTLMPRARELEVIYETYEEGDKGKIITITHREGLQVMVDRVLEKVDGTLIEVKYKHADPRKLIIEVARTVTPQLELIGKIQEIVKDNVTNITVNQVWFNMKAVILKATARHPEVREAIIRELEKEMT